MNRRDSRHAAKHRQLCCLGHWPGTHLPRGFERWAGMRGSGAVMGFTRSGGTLYVKAETMINTNAVVVPLETSGRWIRVKP